MKSSALRFCHAVVVTAALQLSQFDGVNFQRNAASINMAGLKGDEIYLSRNGHCKTAYMEIYFG